MDVIMLNILFFLLYALLFIICIGIIHFIFTILEVTKGVEGNGVWSINRYTSWYKFKFNYDVNHT